MDLGWIMVYPIFEQAHKSSRSSLWSWSVWRCLEWHSFEIITTFRTARLARLAKLERPLKTFKLIWRFPEMGVYCIPKSSILIGCSTINHPARYRGTTFFQPSKMPASNRSTDPLQPLGAAGMSSKRNIPSFLLSLASGRSPCRTTTWIPTKTEIRTVESR